MAGVYIHIPFCKQACHYCNFHFSTTGKYKGEMVDAIIRELELRRDYLEGEPVETIYLGGGTPSLLTSDELDRLFGVLYEILPVNADAEVTLEANPDDLNAPYLALLAARPINRLSIGIQSFFDEELQWMNRSHNASQALSSIELARAAGFDNITIDLIYGVPGSTIDSWNENLDRFFALDIPHLSSYCLTVEPRTALAHFVRSGQTPPPDDEVANAQFERLIERTEEAGFLHYEISNFGREGFLSRHNSAYWKGVPYLGLGPSAHSFNGHARQWNVANNARYMKSLATDELPAETEELDQRTRYNEYVMTALRTMWGVEEGRLADMGARYRDYFVGSMAPFRKKGWVTDADGRYILTRAGKAFADRIAMEAFLVE